MLRLNGKPCLLDGWFQRVPLGWAKDKDYLTKDMLIRKLRFIRNQQSVELKNVIEDEFIITLSLPDYVLEPCCYFTIAPEFHDKEQQKSVRKLFIKEVYAIVNRPRDDLCLIDDWAENIELSEDLQRNIKWYMEFTIPDIVFPGGLQNFIENIWEIGNKDVRESMSTILFPYGL